MSPEPTKLPDSGGLARNGDVPGAGSMRDSGMMKGAWDSLFQPGFMVTTAGFQNIDERPPDPEAAPAKDMPCAVALCSRTAKAPACAPEAAATSADSDTAASVRRRCRFIMRREPSVSHV